MNQDQLNSIIRWIVTACCGWLVSRGWLSDSLIEGIVGVALALGALAWSIFSHSKPETLKAAARIDPDIKIEIPEKVLAEYPSIKELAANPGWQQVVPREPTQ